jgi:hypothetical protein
LTRLWLKGEQVQVWGAENPPDGFRYQGRSHNITNICNRWRVHTRWWEPDESVWREYLKVVTNTGLLCLIYHDLQSEDWFLSRLYD